MRCGVRAESRPEAVRSDNGAAVLGDEALSPERSRLVAATKGNMEPVCGLLLLLSLGASMHHAVTGLTNR